MIFMVTTCGTPKCLRPPASNLPNATCGPCAKGLPPMTNPKSPHAAANAGGFVPRIEKSGRPIQDGEAVMGVPKIVAPGSSAPQKPKNKTDNLKKLGIDAKSARIAVQLLFDMGWLNWEEGFPPVFNELFAKYGNFIAATVKPSTMVGTPDKHKGTINVRGLPEGVLVMDFMYPIEGAVQTLKHLDSPIGQSMRKTAGTPVSSTDFMYAIENDGGIFEFAKGVEHSSDSNYTSYFYEDTNGVKRAIPRWAIG